MTELPSTAEQTVGPFFSLGFEWLYRDSSPVQDTDNVIMTGQVFDGTDTPVGDAVLEFWHPGRGRPSPSTTCPDGFLRVPTDHEGRFRMATAKPNPRIEADGKIQAPHLAVSIFMRGLLRRVVTRVYFPDDAANATDPVLNCVPSGRRATLIAHATAGVLHWDVHMQGPNETVFFEFGP